MRIRLLLLLGLFSRITSLALALIFANFILVFGWAEIVHLYPISGFAVLFLHTSPGTALDGILFRAHVRGCLGHRRRAVHVDRPRLIDVTLAVIHGGQGRGQKNNCGPVFGHDGLHRTAMPYHS